MKRAFALAAATFLLLVATRGAEAQPKKGRRIAPYKDSITDARFPSDARGQVLRNLRGLEKVAEDRLIGQEALVQVLRSKLTNYVDKWGKVEQGAAPFALHMIGPPGIGKTSVFSVLEQMGVRVVRIEAQSYVGENAAKLTDLWSKIAEAEKASKTQPTISTRSARSSRPAGGSRSGPTRSSARCSTRCSTRVAWSATAPRPPRRP